MLDVTRAYGLDFLFPENDTAIGPSLQRAGEFARPEMEILSAILGQTGGTFIDVGANIGSIALPIAARNPSCRVIAIEANRHLATILSANALANRLTNVDVHHAAVGSASGLMSFPTPPLRARLNFGLLSAVDSDQQSLPHEQVRVCTLNEAAPADTTLIKIDAEGFEAQILDGGTRLLGEGKASWLIEYKIDSAASSANAELLRSHGCELFWLWAPFVTPASRKRSDGPFKSGDYNILGLRGSAPPVAMPKVDDLTLPPTTLGAFSYLKNYGYRLD